MDASTYRRMAARLRERMEKPETSYPSGLVFAHMIGGAAQILESALAFSAGSNDIRAAAERSLACLRADRADVVERLKATDRDDAERYEAKAREIESARRVYVWVHANVETSRDAYESQCVAEYTSTVGEFLASEHGDYLTHEDLAELAVGEVLTEGNVRVQRLADVEERAA